MNRAKKNGLRTKDGLTGKWEVERSTEVPISAVNPLPNRGARDTRPGRRAPHMLTNITIDTLFSTTLFVPF